MKLTRRTSTLAFSWTRNQTSTVDGAVALDLVVDLGHVEALLDVELA